MKRTFSRPRLVVAALVAAAFVATSVPAVAPAVSGEGPAPQVAEPDIENSWISYNAKRRRQMAGYSDRHYGIREWKLTPKVIVEHFTATNEFGGTWNYFDRNGTYNGEKPGVCAHFMIEKDGTIHQLVPQTTRCRHVIGLNHRAIGIEIVGTSDKQIMGRERQYEAAQELTLWLMEQHGVQLGDVIGHSESLNSPYYREKVAAWRCQTHSDWSHQHMKGFRDDLQALAQDEGFDVGDKVNREPSGCG